MKTRSTLILTALTAVSLPLSVLAQSSGSKEDNSEPSADNPKVDVSGQDTKSYPSSSFEQQNSSGTANGSSNNGGSSSNSGNQGNTGNSGGKSDGGSGSFDPPQTSGGGNTQHDNH